MQLILTWAALKASGLSWCPWGSLKRCFPDSETLRTGSSPNSRPGLLEVWSADWCHEISTNIESRCLEISIAT